jgi:hypothetical protein
MTEHFDVSGNAFTGAVPHSMEGWLNLRLFDVSGNQLTAVFPSTPHCSLEAMKVLRVARNNLAGTVPMGEPPTVNVYRTHVCCLSAMPAQPPIIRR